MSGTTLQLRVGVTRERGFLFRTCVRPPTSVTIGRNQTALLPTRDPEAPDLHTLFSVGPKSCLLDFRPHWDLKVFQGEEPISAKELLDSGAAFRRGKRVLLQLKPGTRGALRFGSLRMLFKWEEVPGQEVGNVPLRDIGDQARCFSCGQPLRDALVREGLFARCDVCRAMNRFVDPDAPYRRGADEGPKPMRIDPADPFGPPIEDQTASQKIPTVDEVGDTKLGVPIFAGRRTSTGSLPGHVRPAGVGPRAKTPGDVRAQRKPMQALEGMQTIMSRNPFAKGQTAPSLAPLPDGPDTLATPQRIGQGTELLPQHAGDTQPVDPVDEPSGHDSEDDGFGADGAEDDGRGLFGDDFDYEDPLLGTGAHAPVPSQDLPPAPSPEALDQAFYGAEPDAGAIEDPDSGERRVPWATWSVLTARSEFAEDEFRVRELGGGPAAWIDRNAGLLVVLAGVVVLGLGLAAVLVPPGRPEPAPSAGPPPPLPFSPDRALVKSGSYVRSEPDGPRTRAVPTVLMDRHEVRLDQYRAFLEAEGRAEPSAWALDRPDADDMPVWGVEFADAQAFCAWAGARLPTEAEWERAAVGLSGWTWPWGLELDVGRVAAGERPEPVGSHPEGATPERVLDLVGNVPEWVVSEGVPVLKGGGAGPWSKPAYLDPFARTAAMAERWAPGPGFRCVASP